MVAWSVVHSIIYISLVLAEGTDLELRPSECTKLRAIARQYMHMTSHAHLDDVLLAAGKAYAADDGLDRFRRCTRDVRVAMPRLAQRLGLFGLLRELASVDGAVSGAEACVLEALHAAWGLDAVVPRAHYA